MFKWNEIWTNEDRGRQTQHRQNWKGTAQHLLITNFRSAWWQRLFHTRDGTQLKPSAASAHCVWISEWCYTWMSAGSRWDREHRFELPENPNQQVVNWQAYHSYYSACIQFKPQYYCLYRSTFLYEKHEVCNREIMLRKSRTASHKKCKIQPLNIGLLMTFHNADDNVMSARQQHVQQYSSCVCSIELT